MCSSNHFPWFQDAQSYELDPVSLEAAVCAFGKKTTEQRGVPELSRRNTLWKTWVPANHLWNTRSKNKKQIINPEMLHHRRPRLVGRGGGIQDIRNVWVFVKIAIIHKICHEIQNKRIVPVSGGPLYPLC